MSDSKRKPHNDYSGYVAERKRKNGKGHIVLIDRQKGGDWIDADYRYVLITEPEGEIHSQTSRKMAYKNMKALAEIT